MKANRGDLLVFEGVHVDDACRAGVITDVRGPDGGPPYVVRWLDDDHVSLVFPDPEARAESPHHPHAVASTQGCR
jgi:hypothetical protein